MPIAERLREIERVIKNPIRPFDNPKEGFKRLMLAAGTILATTGGVDLVGTIKQDQRVGTEVEQRLPEKIAELQGRIDMQYNSGEIKIPDFFRELDKRPERLDPVARKELYSEIRKRMGLGKIPSTIRAELDLIIAFLGIAIAWKGWRGLRDQRRTAQTSPSEQPNIPSKAA